MNGVLKWWIRVLALVILWVAVGAAFMGSSSPQAAILSMIAFLCSAYMIIPISCPWCGKNPLIKEKGIFNVAGPLTSDICPHCGNNLFPPPRLETKDR